MQPTMNKHTSTAGPNVTIIMYHYVRDTELTPYPDIKALSVTDFIRQLDFLEQHYNFIGLNDILEAYQGNADSLPQKSVLLTFDDGYIDHYNTVFPILKERGINGIFFPSAMPVVESRVLATNKIQFIFANINDIDIVKDTINQAVRNYASKYSLLSANEYWHQHAIASRFDNATIRFIKRMLQYALPDDLRSQLIDEMFTSFVCDDERSFSQNLYMNCEQISEMARQGMSFGSHGYNHLWMDKLTSEEQQIDITASLDFLRPLGAINIDWVMCYPYGGWNDTLIEVAKKMGCKLGFTTKPDILKFNEHQPFCLPRFDTNDIPKGPQDTILSPS